MDKLEKASVVYKTECNGCKEAYVEERGCKLKDRFREHHLSLSLVGQHMTERRYSINNESVSIMHSESNWF